jgi:hypothetical protein
MTPVMRDFYASRYIRLTNPSCLCTHKKKKKARSCLRRQNITGSGAAKPGYRSSTLLLSLL